LLSSSLSCLTIRLGAVVENYHRCARLAGPAAIAPTVKADAYGLGALPIAGALTTAGADTFFVARLEEGIALRRHLPKARIFVLDGAQPDFVEALHRYALTPVLNSLAQISAWSAAAPEHTRLDAAIHIDTGMSRLGLSACELSVLAAQAAKRLDRLRLVLVMSHLACADESGSSMNAMQLARFRAALAMLPPAPASLAASAGLFLGPDYLFDIVRPGLSLLGGDPRAHRGQNPFLVAARLSTRVLQLRRIDKDQSVGYGATFRSARPTVLATVALGYADGLMRAIGNRGAGAIEGTLVPVVGRVSMDVTVLDLGPHSTARIGDEIEFFGDQISLAAHADAAQTNAYEILTRIGPRVKRFYVNEVAP
jgi:alanine racemase